MLYAYLSVHPNRLIPALAVLNDMSVRTAQHPDGTEFPENSKARTKKGQYT